MSNNRLSIRALHTRIEWTKSRGQQRKRWIDNVKEDVQEKDSNIQEASTLWKDCQNWTIFIQAHCQQLDGDPDCEWRTGEMMMMMMMMKEATVNGYACWQSVCWTVAISVCVRLQHGRETLLGYC